MMRTAGKVILGGTTLLVGIKGRETYFRKRTADKRDDVLAAKHGLFDPATIVPKNKPAIVIGAGVVGVSCAYELAKKGYSVLVIDRADSVACECSAAPAGGMQRMNPSVDFNMWITAVKSIIQPLISSDNSFRFFRMNWWNTFTDPHFLRWMGKFTYNSCMTPESVHERNREHMLNFTIWAINELESTMSNEYNGMLAKTSGLVKTGALKLLYSEAAVESAKKQGHWQERDDRENALVLDEKETWKLEPWLKFSLLGDVKGAIFQTDAASANCGWLTINLARICEEKFHVRFENGVSVQNFKFDAKAGVVTAIETNRGLIEVSEQIPVVVAAGAWTPTLLRKLGYFAPVYPLKGYNLSFHVHPPSSTISSSGWSWQKRTNPQQQENHLRVDISSDDVPKRIVAAGYTYVTRFLNEVRLTTIGEFSGWSTAPDPVIEVAVRAEAKQLLAPVTWPLIDVAPVTCGHRPFTYDGTLICGAVPNTKNLFVNVGPGFNGWKCALGAGRLLAAIISGDFSLIPTTVPTASAGPAAAGAISVENAFDPAVFDPKGKVTFSPIFSRIAEVLYSA